MPGVSGIDGLRQLRAIDPNVAVIMLTGFGALETAQEEVVDPVMAQDLDRDAFFKSPVGADGKINHAHAPAAQFRFEPVGAEERARFEHRRRRDRVRRRAVEDTGSLRLDRQHPAEFFGKGGIVHSDAFEALTALRRGGREEFLERDSKLAESLRSHDSQP